VLLAALSAGGSPQQVRIAAENARAKPGCRALLGREVAQSSMSAVRISQYLVEKHTLLCGMAKIGSIKMGRKKRKPAGILISQDVITWCILQVVCLSFVCTMLTKLYFL
jgi:hypothetical protein